VGIFAQERTTISRIRVFGRVYLFDREVINVYEESGDATFVRIGLVSQVLHLLYRIHLAFHNMNSGVQKIRSFLVDKEIQ
jgi:hypothetical protein